MPRILITTNHLQKLQGSEIVTLEIVQFFLTEGWEVDVFTHLLGGEIESLFQNLDGQERLVVTNDDDYPFDNDYKIVWIQHNVLNKWMREYILEYGIKTNFVFNHMSSFVEMEMPLNGLFESKISSKILSVSNECTDVLIKRNISESRIVLFDNPVPEQLILLNPKLRKELKKVVFISNHIPKELIEAAEELKKQKIECVFIGHGYEKVRVTPALINDYDLVVTIGKSVQYALVTGVPVYIYDLYGGDGYINEGNIEHSHYNNFSGRASSIKKNAKAIYEEIIEGYSDALAFTISNRERFIQRWCLTKRLRSLIDDLKETKFIKFEPFDYREIDLHNKRLRKLTAPSWSYRQWFEKTSESDIRLTAIEYILRQNSALVSVDIIIINNEDDEKLKDTLQTIDGQKVGPNRVWVTRGGSHELNEILPMINSSLVLLVNAGDKLHMHAILSISQALLDNSAAKAFYFDEEVVSDEVKINPILKPDINIDLLRSYPYIGKMIAFNVSSLMELGGFKHDFDEFYSVAAVLDFIKDRGLDSVCHIDKVSVRTDTSCLNWLKDENVVFYKSLVESHLSDLGVNASIQTIYISGNNALHIKYIPHEIDTISIITLATDDIVSLKAFIDNIIEVTAEVNYEIIIIRDDALSVFSKSYLAQLESLNISQIRIVDWNGAGNLTTIYNMASNLAKGNILVFMRDYLLPLDKNWLKDLSGYLSRNEVGLIGPKIINCKSEVCGAGLVLGMNGSFGRIYEGASLSSSGYLNRLQVANNISALTNECILIKKDVFLSMNGFNDVDLFDGYSEVDLALRLGDAGYCNVFLPHVRMLKIEGKNSQSVRDNRKEYENFLERWIHKLHRDPAYNRQLSRHSPGFELSPYLSSVQRNLPGKPLPVVIANNVDSQGCGYYRVLHPFKALANELYIDGGTTSEFIKIPDIMEFNPDILLIQPGTRRGISNYINKIRRFTDAKIILDYDDYTPNIPVRSMARRYIKQDVIKDIRKDCSLADWIVVSTPALAEEFYKFTDRIRIAPNGLPREIWGNVSTTRRGAEKIRVGWAGGSSHTGDLSLLKPLMKIFESEVQWVFMGMKPDGVDCEFHAGVPIEVYPEKLASLDLDLALVPLEINQFNVCKSNLRLLEIGACGVPVICTDIEPFRCGLPVTLVSNDFASWVKAIKEHLNNRDFLPKLGDELRKEIHLKWLLEEDLLQQWRNAWTM